MILLHVSEAQARLNRDPTKGHNTRFGRELDYTADSHGYPKTMSLTAVAEYAHWGTGLKDCCLKPTIRSLYEL